MMSSALKTWRKKKVRASAFAHPGERVIREWHGAWEIQRLNRSQIIAWHFVFVGFEIRFSLFFFFLTWIMVWWWLITDSEPSALCDWNWSTCQSPSLTCGDSCWIKHTDKVGKKNSLENKEKCERETKLVHRHQCQPQVCLINLSCDLCYCWS